MGSYHGELWLPQSVDQVFKFFADPVNLQRITPDWVGFSLLSPGRLEMRAGALIEYRLKIHGIPVKWQSEITAWEPPHRFVDEQRRGPYRRWVHEHRFVPQRQGTLIQDQVQYSVPGGWILERLFVNRDIRKIFEFRCGKLQNLFGGGAN